MKKIALLLLALLLTTPAWAQLTLPQVTNDIDTQLTSCAPARCNTAASLRGLLDIITNAAFQAQGANGLNVTGTPTVGNVLTGTGGSTAAWSPVAIAAGTPITGCPPLSVLFNNSNVLGCENGLKYTPGGGPLQLNQFGILTSPAPATWQFGALDTGSPVQQTLRFQGAAGGNLNAAGQHAIIKLSPSTGSGAAGGLSIQATPAGASGISQNAYTTAIDYNVLNPGFLTFGFPVSMNANALYGGVVPNGLNIPFYIAATNDLTSTSDLIAIRGTNIFLQNLNGSVTYANYNATNSGRWTWLVPVTFSNASLAMTALGGGPGSGGGVYVCIDSNGVLYKKAVSCP